MFSHCYIPEYAHCRVLLQPFAPSTTIIQRLSVLLLKQSQDVCVLEGVSPRPDI